MNALKMAVMWHGVAFLPKLRELPAAELREACNQASALSGERVLHMQPDASSQEFDLPAFPWPRKLSGAQVIAVMVFGLWVLCGEREEMCSSLVETWPIRDALILAPRPWSAAAGSLDAAAFNDLMQQAAERFAQLSKP